VLALAAAASADDPGLGLRRFGPDGGGRDTLTVGTGTVGPEGQVRVFVASELERAPFVLLPSGQIEGGRLVSTSTLNQEVVAPNPHVERGGTKGRLRLHDRDQGT